MKLEFIFIILGGGWGIENEGKIEWKSYWDFKLERNLVVILISGF